MEDDPNDPRTPAFTRDLLQGLVRGVGLSNALPSEDARELATSFPQFQQNVGQINTRLTGMMHGFVEQHGGPLPGGQPPMPIDDVSDRFDTVVDLTDRMLERVDGDLERHAALAMPPQQPALPGMQAQQQRGARPAAALPASAGAGSAGAPGSGDQG